jgi:hypothetical protein
MGVNQLNTRNIAMIAAACGFDAAISTSSIGTGRCRKAPRWPRAHWAAPRGYGPVTSRAIPTSAAGRR